MNLEAKDRLASLVNQARGNLSKSAFAELLDVSHTSVASWEKGTYMPDVKSLLRISGCLPLKQLAVVERAVSDRLFAIAESAGR